MNKRRSTLAMVIAALLVLAIWQAGPASTHTFALQVTEPTGTPTPSVAAPPPDDDRLPGLGGPVRTPDTNSPRSYTYLNPAEKLRNSPAPDSDELDAVGIDYKKYPAYSRERAVARWNVRLAKYESDLAKYRQGTLTTRSGRPAAEPVEPEWDDWLNRIWIPNQGNNHLGNSYVDYVVQQLGLGGNHGWMKEGKIPGAPADRTYDLINYEKKIAYEIKSGATPASGQLPLDQQNLAALEVAGWRIGYIFGGEVTDGTLSNLKNKAWSQVVTATV